jgi:hypothetical protein
MTADRAGTREDRLYEQSAASSAQLALVTDRLLWLVAELQRESGLDEETDDDA